MARSINTIIPLRAMFRVGTCADRFGGTSPPLNEAEGIKG